MPRLACGQTVGTGTVMPLRHRRGNKKQVNQFREFFGRTNLPSLFPEGNGHRQHAVIKLVGMGAMPNGPIRAKQINQGSSVIG